MALDLDIVRGWRMDIVREWTWMWTLTVKEDPKEDRRKAPWKTPRTTGGKPLMGPEDDQMRALY